MATYVGKGLLYPSTIRAVSCWLTLTRCIQAQSEGRQMEIHVRKGYVGYRSSVFAVPVSFPIVLSSCCGVANLNHRSSLFMWLMWRIEDVDISVMQST